MSAPAEIAASPDFTEARYEAMLALAKAQYRFEPFGSESREPHVLWRHDIDYSMRRAHRVAVLDAEAGVRSTFFLLLGSPYYNLFEIEETRRARDIAAMGHHVGLHFDSLYYERRGGSWDLEDRMAFERGVLADLLGAPIMAVSFHNPALAGILDVTRTHLGGMLNVYGDRVRADYRYASDSFGFWRFKPIHEVLAEHASQNLHILTHPIWWTAEPKGPRAKIMACAAERHREMQSTYDELLRSAGMYETVMAVEARASGASPDVARVRR